MNLKQLEAFILVTEQRNFTKAARLLFMTQPAISFQIKSLEEHVGAPIFERQDKTVKLTDVGKVLYPEAKKILASYDKVKEAIAEITGLRRGTLVIGASTIPGEYLLPQLIGGFKSKYQEIDVTLKIRSTSEIVNLLLEREVDIGVVGAPVKNPSLQSKILDSDELVLIAANDHPLSRARSVTIEEALGYDFIIREKGSGTRMALEEALRERGLSSLNLKIAMELGTTRAIITGVEAGLGISFVSRWAAQGSLKLGTITEIPVVNFAINRNFYIIFNKHKYRGIAPQAFLDHLQDQLGIDVNVNTRGAGDGLE